MKSSLIYSMFFFSLGCQRSSFNFESSKIDLTLPSNAKSEILATLVNYADGVTPAKIEIVMRNYHGVSMPNKAVVVTVSGQQNTITPCSITDLNGVSVCWLYSTKAEIKRVSTVGEINIWKDVTFGTTPSNKSMAALLPAGTHQKLGTGHKMTLVTGEWFSEFHLKDSFDKKRLNSTILSIMPEH